MSATASRAEATTLSMVQPLPTPGPAGGTTSRDSTVRVRSTNCSHRSGLRGPSIHVGTGRSDVRTPLGGMVPAATRAGTPRRGGPLRGHGAHLPEVPRDHADLRAQRRARRPVLRLPGDLPRPRGARPAHRRGERVARRRCGHRRTVARAVAAALRPRALRLRALRPRARRVPALGALGPPAGGVLRRGSRRRRRRGAAPGAGGEVLVPLVVVPRAAEEGVVPRRPVRLTARLSPGAW